MYFKRYLINIFCLFPLLLGGLIYISFRDEDILLLYWLRKLNLNYSLLRYTINTDNNIIKSYIIYSLPNGLWLLSGMLIIGIIWKNKQFYFYLYTSILIFIALFIEISQIFNIIRGTFDLIDIFTIIVFSFIGIFYYKLRGYNEKK